MDCNSGKFKTYFKNSTVGERMSSEQVHEESEALAVANEELLNQLLVVFAWLGNFNLSSRSIGCRFRILSLTGFCFLRRFALALLGFT